MKRLLPLLLLLWILAPSNVKAQASVAMYCWNPTGSSATNNQFVPCSSTNPLQVAGTFTATVTFPTIGAAVPSTGLYDGINVAGTLRGWTGVNPSGSIYAAQIDVASIGGTALALGQAAMAASLPVAIASNQSTLPVQGGVNTTPTDCSGVITSGATAQNAFTAAATRHGFVIANIDATEVLWFSTTGTAAASGTGSFPLAPATATTFAGLASFSSPFGFGINTALSVIAATTNHKFSCTVY